MLLAAASLLLCGVHARGEEAAEEEARGEEAAPPVVAEDAPAGAEEAAGEGPEGPGALGPPSGDAPEVTRLSLETCLDIARERNLDLRIEEHKREKARLDVSAARAAFLPTLTASYTRDYEAEKDSGSLSLTQSTPWGGALSVTGNHSTDAEESSSSMSVTVSQELFRGAGTAEGRASLSIAETNQLGAIERLERLCQNTVYEVKSRYYDVARLLATVEVRRQAVGRAKRLRDEAAFRRDRGMITVLDYANAAIQLADREAALVSSERRLEDALDGLKELLDKPMGEEIAIEAVFPDVEEVHTDTERKEIFVDHDAGTVSIIHTRTADGGRIDLRTVFTPEKRDRDALLEEALQGRPDLAASRLEFAAKRIELRRRRNQLLNRLKLSATWNAAGEGDVSADSLEMDEGDWKVSLDYSWPVGRVARRAGYEKAAIDVMVKETEVHKFEIAVEKDIRRVDRLLGETETNILTYAQKISAAARALEAAKIRKQGGQTTYWEVTARESDLLNAQTSFINAYLDYQKRLAELDRATGKRSGWTEGP